MLEKLLKPEIDELIKGKNWHQIKEILLEWSEPDIAELLKNMEEKDAIVLFMLLPKELKAEVFAELESEKQAIFLKKLHENEVKDIILELSPDDRTELFEEMPARITKKLLYLLPPEERKETLQLLGYPEESVGRLMTPDFVAVRPHWTVEQALEHIRQYGVDAETVNRIYVVDDSWKLLDDISVRKIILARGNQKIEELMDRNFVAISAFEDQEKAIRLIKKYNLYALPVVNKENILLGIVTVDDILDVYEEEVTEDVHKSGGIVPLETSYAASPPVSLYKKRVGWLLLFLASGFVSSAVITYFEGMIAKVVALAAFIPVMIGEGGNIGNQASTLITRSLALGELTVGKWLKIIKKELGVGVLLGLSLGIAIGLWGYVWKGAFEIGLVVGTSMILISLWANLLGSALPLILVKLKMDPAIICSSLLTTVIDITGLLIYFGIASIILF